MRIPIRRRCLVDTRAQCVGVTLFELKRTELRCYFIFRCEFVNPSPAEGESDMKVVSDRKFLEKVSPNTLAIYQEVMNEVMKRTGPVRQLGGFHLVQTRRFGFVAAPTYSRIS